jgi:hypothetical protein
MAASNATLFVPLQLNALVLNPKLCEEGDAKIAPITQPNYTFLRLTDNLITADVLDHVDLHCVSPAQRNSRLTDLGTGKLLDRRIGVYLHWTLPQVYRSGSAAAKGSPNAATARKQMPDGSTAIDPTSGDPTSGHATRKLQQGFPAPPEPLPGSTPDYSAPEFRPAPNRWIVIRRIHPDSIPSNVEIPLLEAFVVESDRLKRIDQIGPQEDVETDYSPFINPADLVPTGKRIIDGPAEWFIGSKTSLADWVKWKQSGEPALYSSQFTPLTSSNPLFADYMPHNTNVFSIIDDFEFKSANSTIHLDSATADYYVLGWHSDPADDPMTTDHSVTAPVHSDRLDDCNMCLKDPSSGSAPSWIASASATRVLCHASMYGVKYSRTAMPDSITSLASKAGARLKKEQPIAIGVTPLDALLAYCRGHSDEDVSPMSDLEIDLLKLQSLLLATENDDVDALKAAADESYEEAFTKFEGGTQWHYQMSTPGGKPAPPPNPATFAKFNSDQASYDNALRESLQMRGYLFLEWWKYVSGLIEDTRSEEYKTQLAGWKTSLANAKQKMMSIQPSLPNAATNPVPDVQKGTSDRFYQRKDPTILFGGIKSGFEPDFSDALPVRLGDQLVSTSTSPPDTAWAGFDSFADRLTSTPALFPSDLKDSALSSLKEFSILSPSNPGNTSATAPQTIPWFHDEPGRKPNPESRGRDLWKDTQPWLPLFIEWEAYYYHIPYKSWHLQESGRLSNWGSKVLHHGFDHPISADSISNKVTVSGRVILMPQASSNLKVAIDQVFRTTNDQDLENIYQITDQQKTDLSNITSNLDFVSSTMTGLTSQLLTLNEGTHLKPVVRLPNQKPMPIQVALDAASNIGFTEDMMKDMDIQTTLTPYGDSVSFETDDPPMKLVTHGQLMFTKLNVIDKFGQAICAIDPSPHHIIPAGIPMATINPCLGDTYFPGTVGDIDPTQPDAVANVVIAQSNKQACPFVQLTPSINQPARLNAHFVIRDDTTNLWRPCTEWEPCIWGWLVVNYADYGLQFFLADGTFYREVRVGGPFKATAQPRWLPFERPTKLGPDVRGRSITQLDYLISKCGGDDGNYLQALFDMINQSVSENESYPPNSYSAFPSAIVGKPLALVNTGWSLELAGPENKNWSTVNTAEPYPKLLGRPVGDTSDDYYRFPVKLGDRERTFDGLVGYFKTPDTPDKPITDPDATGLMASDFNLDNIYTYFNDVTSTDTTKPRTTPDPRVPIDVPNFPIFDPYYISAGSSTKSTTDLTLDHNTQLQIFGMIMDPFLPIHAYSAILPNQNLQLPVWQVEQGLKNISAFFHFGPLMLPADVPTDYDPKFAVEEEYSNSLAAPPATPTPGSADAIVGPPQVPIPVQSHQSWKWLQPYAIEGQNTDPVTGVASSYQTKFNAFDLSPDAAAGQDAQDIRLPNAPYTAVEGYLQLVNKSAA